jgi:hypothetical protein
MSLPEMSPLARLIVFTVFLAIAGSLVAGVHWYVVDLPQQHAPAPQNAGPGDIPGQCRQTCWSKHCIAMIPDQPQCDAMYAACLAGCST